MSGEAAATARLRRTGDELRDVDNRVTGSVGDGPIVGARIACAPTRPAMLLSEFTSSSTADYDVVVKTQGKNYP
jgi:hypothetical protein